MPTVYEVIDGESFTSGDGASATLPYKVVGTTVEATARSLVLAVAPVTIGTSPVVYLQSIETSAAGYDVWEAIANYGPVDPATSQFSFDSTGGTSHITQSRATLQKIPAPGQAAAPDFGGLINVSKDDVKGVDIVTPIWKFSETHKFNPLLITPAYRKTLRDLTGTINNAPFRGSPAGDVLFAGANGSWTTSDAFSVTYNFVVISAWNNEPVGPFNITKRGHDLLWTAYAQDKDDAAKRLTQKPIAAYVEEVYQSSNFALLGIG